MKYIVIIPDGAADVPCTEVDNKTPLAAAKTPALDRLAAEGHLGLATTVPPGMEPGSDVANLSLLGYDPKEGYTGRAALEAASLGIEIPPDAAVFRANLVTVVDGVMKDYSAGHISTPEGAELINSLNQDLGIEGVRLYPGVGYRHICLIENAAVQIPACVPPHQILDAEISEHAPQGGFSSWVLEVERTSREHLAGYPVNQKRIEEGKAPATQLWLWGGATAMSLSPFASRYGLATAGLISAVDLMRGIGKLGGMDVITVPGATGYYDTDYAGKARAALDYIYNHDFICLHVEAPDEAGHNGDLVQKIKAIENIDRHIVTPLAVMARHFGDWRIMVAPDHHTPVSSRKHVGDPVPYLLWGGGETANGAKAFTESEATRVGGETVEGKSLMGRLTAPA
ncbi:MAG: cofactor-independent phosphoglycerate mutase [Planctomycetota bacterium]|jgi:2,3-bisphosphoglycerate-independent phosphoglycerate mutase|nr:cofactor-independent phosphoglycerate mutase [Planctomycetota bacterium]